MAIAWVCLTSTYRIQARVQNQKSQRKCMRQAVDHSKRRVSPNNKFGYCESKEGMESNAQFRGQGERI
jgi:hypothetical protein